MSAWALSRREHAACSCCTCNFKVKCDAASPRAGHCGIAGALGLSTSLSTQICGIAGALGLSRRLSTQILTPQEANALAQLPLPPALHRLDQQLFPAVNAMYGFLLRQHIQVPFPIHHHCSMHSVCTLALPCLAASAACYAMWLPDVSTAPFKLKLWSYPGN